MSNCQDDVKTLSWTSRFDFDKYDALKLLWSLLSLKLQQVRKSPRPSCRGQCDGKWWNANVRYHVDSLSKLPSGHNPSYLHDALWKRNAQRSSHKNDKRVTTIRSTLTAPLHKNTISHLASQLQRTTTKMHFLVHELCMQRLHKMKMTSKNSWKLSYVAILYTLIII